MSAIPAPLGLISSLEPGFTRVGGGGAPGSTGPWPLPLGGLADGAGATLPHQGSSASLTGLHRCAWNGSARQRVWNKCAASWTRRPSETSGTSRTPEGPGETVFLHCRTMRPRLWGLHDGVFPLFKPGVQGTGPSLPCPSRASSQEWLSLLLPRVTLDEGPNSLLEPKVQAQPCSFLAAMLPPEPQPSCPCPLARLPDCQPILRPYP